MANFLDYIRTIFKLSGSQALPSGSSIDLPIPTAGQWSQTFTAAFDGYVDAYFLNSKAVEISNTTTKIRAKVEANISAGVYIPVRKGDQFNVYFDYTDTTDAVFKLVKTVGSS